MKIILINSVRNIPYLFISVKKALLSIVLVLGKIWNCVNFKETMSQDSWSWISFPKQLLVVLFEFSLMAILLFCAFVRSYSKKCNLSGVLYTTELQLSGVYHTPWNVDSAILYSYRYHTPPSRTNTVITLNLKYRCNLIIGEIQFMNGVHFKGTVSRDFWMLVFCIKLLLLVPLEVLWDDLVFSQKFAEIFKFEMVSAV